MNDYMKKLDKIEENKNLTEQKKWKKQEVGEYIDKLDKYDLKDFIYGVVKR